MAILTNSKMTVLEGKKLLLDSFERLIVVTNTSNHVVGTVSQGDLLRAESDGQSLSEIMQLNPIVSYPSDKDQLLKLKQNKLSEIVIVDDDGCYVKTVKIWDFI